MWATWVVHVDPSHGAVRNDLNCDIFRLGARLVNHVVYVPAADVDFCHANKPSTGGEGPRVAAPTPTASWDRLEVVLRHVVDDLPAEDLRLYVGSPEVQARPDAGVDDLHESVRESVEVARFAWEAGAYHAEPDPVRTEEHLQYLKMRAVATEVP